MSKKIKWVRKNGDGDWHYGDTGYSVGRALFGSPPRTYIIILNDSYQCETSYVAKAKALVEQLHRGASHDHTTL